MPYDTGDRVDLFVVSVRSGEQLGQFVFPKEILVQKGFVSKGGGGKRAMRVYPPWDMPSSNKARDTQTWQLSYFFKIKPSADIPTNTKTFSVLLNS